MRDMFDIGPGDRIHYGTSIVEEELKVTKTFRVLPEGSTAVSGKLIKNAINKTMDELAPTMEGYSPTSEINAASSVSFHDGNIRVTITVRTTKGENK